MRRAVIAIIGRICRVWVEETLRVILLKTSLVVVPWVVISHHHRPRARPPARPASPSHTDAHLTTSAHRPRPGLASHAHWHAQAQAQAQVHAHASAIAFNPRKRLLLRSTRPKPPSRRTRVPRSKTAFALFRRRARPCRMFAGQNTVRASPTLKARDSCESRVPLHRHFFSS
jgi:hypothetical protein